jgi:serine/threonine protein kinase
VEFPLAVNGLRTVWMLSPNTVLQNRYRIVRQLGRGGMGAVYEAIDQRLSRTVALKETLVDSDELRRAFEHEARLLANLRHPALPKVIDHFIEGDGQYLVMEYIPGDDLADQLGKRGKPFPPGDVMRWTDELLDALDYLHSHEPPIIHRDIKPHNLKLTPQGRIILLDFGLAKGVAGEMTRVGSGSGVSLIGYTPHFASLEQIQGERTSSRSDLYSLAATIYSLLTNTIPTDALKRATELINDEADPLRPLSSFNSNIPPEFSGVLTKALSLKPSERPASASAMRAALLSSSSLAQDADDEVTRVSTPNRTTYRLDEIPVGPPVTADERERVTAVTPSIPERPESNRKWWIVAGILGLLVVLAGGTFLALRPHEPVSTVAPTGVPADAIPSPFNTATGSVAALVIQDGDGKTIRQATGVFVRPDEVATSLSAIEGAARGRVALVGQSGSFEIGGVTGFDPVHGLVSLKVNGAKSKPLAASADKRTTAGDKVASLATATRYKEAGFFEPTFAQGSITGYNDADQIEVRLDGGTVPGAPLLNAQGDLIGIISSVSGGNANQAAAVPVSYLADMAAHRQSGMSLAMAGAKEILLDFRQPLASEKKPPSKELEAKVIAAVRDAHRKTKQVPSPEQNTNGNSNAPAQSGQGAVQGAGQEPAQQQQQPPPLVEKDDLANAEVSGVAEGAFTAPGAKQIAYLIDTRAGSPADNFGPKYLAIFNGDSYVTDFPLKNYSLILQSLELNKDGINELLLASDYMQMGVLMHSAELVDINKGKLRGIRDFGIVYQYNCGADDQNGVESASVILSGVAGANQFPDLRIDNYSAPCGTEGANSPNWKYSSTGKMQQKY